MAKEFLAKHGIPLVTVYPLPRTYLDGFCLLHELAHVGRHMDIDGQAAFVDDLSLRDVGGAPDDPREAQADEWAEEALVPRAIWESSAVREEPTAASLQHHVVAGRWHSRTRNSATTMVWRTQCVFRSIVNADSGHSERSSGVVRGPGRFPARQDPPGWQPLCDNN